jgi:hypothetical protein
LDNREKTWEICTSLYDGGSTNHKLGWGYVKEANHITLEENIKEFGLEFFNDIIIS